MARDPLQTGGLPPTVEQSFELCGRLARSHYENFSVATRLVPPLLRRHFYAVYAFCRGVDDLGDEASGDRLSLLDGWKRQLELCYSGVPQHPYFIALQNTIETFDISPDPFLKLIEANRRDQITKRYSTYAQLLDYCDHSANPVGRIVLTVFGYRDSELHSLSDHTCTALQLTNFWQDVSRDYDNGRIYLPQSEMTEFDVTEPMIAGRVATAEFKRLLRFEVARTRDLFRLGAPLVNRVTRTARVDIALFTAGGLAVLRKIERQGYDVLSSRPELSKAQKGRLLTATWLRSRLGLAPLPASALR